VIGAEWWACSLGHVETVSADPSTSSWPSPLVDDVVEVLNRG
jgi:hypothetical protein